MNEAKIVSRLIKEGEAVVKSQDRLVSAVEKALKESCNRTMSQLDKVKLATVINNVSDLLMMNEAEGTQVTDIAKKAEFLNLVVTTWAKSTLPVSTMTFAMTQETSVVYYLSYQYDTNKGGINKGDVLNSYDQYWVDDDKVEAASKYASSEIDVETVDAITAAGTYKIEFTPVVPGTIKLTDGDDEYTDDAEGNVINASGTTVGTVDYETGIITSTTLATAVGTTIAYEYNNQIAPVQVPKLKLKDTKLILNAKAYTLGYEYSTFAAFNLLRSQNVDLKDLLGEGAANELVAEIDSIVYNDFAKSGTTLGLTFNMNPTGFYDERLYMQSFGLRLVQAQQLVFNKTRKIRPNVVVMGTNGAYIARNLEGFTSQEQANPIGIHVIGTYKGMTLIENPFQDEDLNILTYKAGEFTGSYAVGDYMPVIQTQLLQYEDFRNTSSLATMKAKKMLNTKFFAEVIITHNA
jgi:hypothetical protein